LLSNEFYSGMGAISNKFARCDSGRSEKWRLDRNKLRTNTNGHGEPERIQFFLLGLVASLHGSIACRRGGYSCRGSGSVGHKDTDDTVYLYQFKNYLD